MIKRLFKYFETQWRGVFIGFKETYQPKKGCGCDGGGNGCICSKNK